MGIVRFVLRTDKPNQEGFSPIELVYQLKGKRKYFRTKEKLKPGNWDQKKQKAAYLNKESAKKLRPPVGYDLLLTTKEVEKINNRLGTLRTDIEDIEDRYRLNGNIAYSTKMVIQGLQRKRSENIKEEAPANQVFDFIDKYIEENKSSREPGSMSVYKSLKNHLQNFESKRKEKVTFADIDYSFFKSFQNFLINTKGRGAPNGLGNVTIAKQLSTLKTFLNYARMHGIEVSNKYKEFKIKKEPLEVIALTNIEFETLYNFDLSKQFYNADNESYYNLDPASQKALSQVRDVFCFSCSTGLRYSDMAQLKREHIKNDDEIRLTVTKTKQLLSIPLNQHSYSILAKYADMPRPLPIVSNVRMNEQLKVLCKLAEINEIVEIVRFRGSRREENSYPKHELISVHTGRKTFCTLSLEKGASAEEVMKISGHKDYSSFSRYVKITEQRSKIVMRNTWGEIRRPAMKAV